MPTVTVVAGDRGQQCRAHLFDVVRVTLEGLHDPSIAEQLVVAIGGFQQSVRQPHQDVTFSESGLVQGKCRLK